MGVLIYFKYTHFLFKKIKVKETESNIDSVSFVEGLQFILDYQVVFLSQVFSATFLLQMCSREAWRLFSYM